MCYPYCMGILYVYNLFIRSCILYTMMDFQNEVTKSYNGGIIYSENPQRKRP